MALYVVSAFDEFLANTVNLAAAQTTTARDSCEWLMDQIHAFPGRHGDFPLLYEECDIAFGSFARRTKIRPLDDIDQIACLHANGATYLAPSHDDVRLTVLEGTRLYEYRHDGSSHLNSRKIVNRFVRALEDVPQYRRAEINRRSEAATLQLVTYDWNFDIVPAFMTAPEQSGETFYLIPNGQGHWKKTDPRKDRDRVGAVNHCHEGWMLNVLRLVKYWQRRATMPTISSYLLECMVVDHFALKHDGASKYPDEEMASTLRSIAQMVMGRVQDPKGIQWDLNDLDFLTRATIRDRANLDAGKCDEARNLEIAKDQRGSIGKWREIFGSEFPQYG